MSGGQIRVFRDLESVNPSIDFSLVGALAIACLQPGYSRQTNDVDISIATPMQQASEAFTGITGWTRSARSDHEWKTGENILVHVIPADPESLERGFVVWPGGRRMSLLGMRHALVETKRIQVAEDLSIRVASLPSIMLMKAVAYQDRPSQRERDLVDFSEVMDLYLPDDDPRRWDEAADVSFDDAGAYLLGRDIRRIADDEEAESVQRFATILIEGTDGGTAQAVLIRSSRPALRAHPESILSRLRSFQRGLM